ncbi:DNA topoisomerase 2 [Zea mays]|uniref:DNA topoisomerase 2 n=1 Tax=Zea mays TaxID=4577 RepID=A0A1D6HGU5_MAIZE|nr:DNA topoisomerase 2 [Zea mays]
MAAPLHSSSGHNAAAGGGAKTIEEMYQKKTQLEHILLRPDTYIGSVEKHTQALWIYEDGAMVNRSVTYVPGLYKIFDEILVNAADNKQRDPKMDALRVEIDVDSCCISVYNNGDGIPVEVHQEEGVYVPEMILGHLLTSSNYNDNEKKTTGGRNGYGAKLTNIFSTEFVIETADGRRQKKYKQVFYENMGKKSEPQITKCKQGENWTRVTFKPDLAKFNMTHLEDDVVALMRKRVVDMAGTLGKTVKVELDGQRVPIKSFCDYVDLYMKSANCDRPDNFKRIYEQVNDRWEVCVSQSEGQFQQVSFVNRIATIRGGSHVDYVTNQIANHVVAIVNKKNKNANMKLHNVKSHLWVFVNALIDNPAFDSQTKETLTTRQGSFGSKCELSSDFLKKVEKSGVIENVLSWADFKLSKELKKTDGSKKSRISGIPKLEDANEAGGKDSDKCTLILTEGDSAKALAMSGIAVVGRDYYGVFPLRGKLLNVREANHKQIMDNAEIQHIKQILGLQHGKQYESTKGLRYGHLMIMTDQDHDGSHIKGLLINFIHSFWPSLLKVPSFLVEFITPIIKATRGQTTKSFYTMPEYEEWRKNLGASASSWTIKYYKGLGTSTAKEGRKYFEDIIDHKKDFVWVDDQDGNHIELAFSKKRIADRKQWLTNFQRSIPSMVDGLKPGQRKILFCSFKRNFVKEAKVAQFSGYVSEHSAYHHGEQSLASTIIGMAQNFVGSNNINLMSPNGQFGTRAQGGKDAASPRYIFTKLSNITRSIFPKDDDILLNYLNEDGQSIEPTWYMPILPMVLVNGSEGIGTGWSTYIPNYNPRDIVANVRRLLNEESTVPMHPWYRGFKGSIEKTVNTKVAGSTYTVTGIIEVVDNTTLRITELPIRRWTQDYKDFLESLAPDPKNKDKVTFIEDVTSQGDNEDVYIQLKLSEANVNVAKEEGLVKKFKLTTTIGTTNMHLFDSDGKIRKYDTPEQILEEFFQLRLEFYCKRKEALLKNIKLDLKKLENKVRFIRCVVDNEIIVNNRKRADLFLELRHKNFDPFPKKKKKAEPTAVGAIEEEENEESPETAAGVDPSDYEYLLSMSIGTLTLEKIQELNAEKQKLVDDVVELMNTSPKSLWLKDLDAFEKELDVLDQMDLAEEVQREKRIKEGKKGGSKAAPKKQPKKAAPIKLESSTEDNAAEPVVAKRGAQQKKAPKKAPVDEEEVDMPSLKDRLAAFNINDSSPPDHSAMETETTEQPAQKKGRGKKPAAAAVKPKAPAARKRAPTQGGKATQKKIDEMLKVTEDNTSSALSPEKKVRKMRPSPFNKKSGSILQRGSTAASASSETIAEASPPSGSSEEPVAAAKPRRTARATKKHVYISESDPEDEVVELSDDSDFDLDADSD